MECGVQSAMIGVAPPGGDSVPQPLATSVFPGATESDQAQFEADKRAVYKHPLFPLLALLLERCELSTISSDPQSSDAFNMDIQAFVQHQKRDRKPFLANEPEIDGLIINAIQVLGIHLLELEKVQEICKDFCNRYITRLKSRMRTGNLPRSDYPQDVVGTGPMNSLENNNNSMMSHGNSASGSTSNSRVQYSISPSQPNLNSVTTDCAKMRYQQVIDELRLRLQQRNNRAFLDVDDNNEEAASVAGPARSEVDEAPILENPEINPSTTIINQTDGTDGLEIEVINLRLDEDNSDDDWVQLNVEDVDLGEVTEEAPRSVTSWWWSKLFGGPDPEPTHFAVVK